MRPLLAIAVVLAGLLLRADAAASDVSTLIERLKQTVQGGAAFYEHEQIAKELQVHGADAVRHLLPLLRDEHGGLRYVAAVALADCDGLTDAHLEPLVAAARDEPQASQIPLAIAKVGTPRAVDFLVHEFLRIRDPFNSNLTAAMRRLGEKALPSLLKIYRTEEGWGADLEHRMYDVFSRMGDKAAAATEPLLKMASDEREPATKRFRAVRTLAALSPSALLQFFDSDKGTLRPPPIDNVGEAFTTVELMRTIATLQSRAVSAGPLVQALVRSNDWEVRVAAARTVGRIGYTESADELIKLLKDRTDWRLAYGAAESLRILKCEAAVSELTELSTTHWYPPVREAALQAITGIESDAPKEETEPAEQRPRGFPDLDDVGRDNESLGEDEADQLQLTTVPPTGDLRVKIKGDDGTVRMEERRGIHVDGGYLVGRDVGEWGGDIAFVDFEGNSHVLAEDNTQEVYNTAAGVFAITGGAHMGFNSGFIYKLTWGTDQQWRAAKWRTLPGAPRFSRVLKDGSLFVSCIGGMVLVSPDGEMKAMTRSACLGESDR